jgi:hypothetical protein
MPKLVKKTKKPLTRKTKAQGFREREQDSGFGLSNNYRPLDELTVTQIRDFIVTSAWIDSCAAIIADECIKFPLQTDPVNPDIDSWLKYPSNIEPLSIIRKKYIKDMTRYGNGCCMIEYKKGKPSRLIPIAGYLLRPTTDDPPKYNILKMTNGNFSEGSYVTILDKNNKEVPAVYKDREIMHFAIDIDADSALARSPLKKVYNLLQADGYINQNLAQFTSKGFYMPSFLSLEKIGDKEFKTFVEWLNLQVEEGSKFFGVNKKASSTAIPHWSAEDIVKVSRWIGLCVANVFKVPPFMLNLIEDTGSLNAREQRQRFLENVVAPIVAYEGHLFTLILAKKGFKNFEVEISAPGLGTKLTSDKAKIARLVYPDGEILTQDEVRRFFFGLDPIPNNKKVQKSIES